MAEPKDPLLSPYFALDLGGKLAGFFTHVGGLGSESEVIEHKVVNDKGKEKIQVYAGRLKWTPITLKRGITDSLDIWEWRDKVVKGDMEGARVAATITAFLPDGTPLAKWNMVRAWPSKITGPEFDTATGNVIFEEVTIVFEGVKREAV